MRAITFNHLARETHSQQKQFLSAFRRILNRGIYLAGPENAALTQRLNMIFGKHCIPVGSGHDAILLSLQALSLGSTDEIIVPANAYPTAFAVSLSGAKVIFADVDDNGQLSADSVKRMITKHTKAVMLVHMYGLCADIETIIKICQKHRVLVIEDCAQSFGTLYQKKYTGTIGDIGCFSFYPTKNVGALGDGGAIRTKNTRIAARIKLLSMYGEHKRYESIVVAGHSRLAELQAAGIVISLTQASAEFQKRKRVARWYTQALGHPSLTPHIRVLTSHPASVPVIHLFVIRARHRDALQKYLTKQNIPTAIHYPHPSHLVKAFANLRYKKGDFPKAEQLSREILSLPYHAYMTKSDILRVIHHIRNFYETHP